MIRAVIFDFNGVIVDDERVHFELFRDVLAQEGVTLTEAEYYEKFLGCDDRGAFVGALDAANQETPSERIEALIARKARQYADAAESGLRFFPGAAETVRALALRYPVAVCSGALRPEIEYALNRLGIRESIFSVVSSEDTTHCKPDPEGYLLTLAALRLMPAAELDDLEPRSCLVIEDSLAGVEAAKAAGMYAVGVTHTYSEAELKSAGADAVVTSLSEITPEWIAARHPMS